MFADLMIAAVAILCQEKSVEPLAALAQRQPLSLLGPHGWPLIGAILAAVRDHSDGPLRELARQHRDPDPRRRRVARVAGAVLSSPHALEVALRVNGAHTEPLDEQLFLRAPWAQVAKVDPAAARALEKVLPRESSPRDGAGSED
jgi:hypothetical protein